MLTCFDFDWLTVTARCAFFGRAKNVTILRRYRKGSSVAPGFDSASVIGWFISPGKNDWLGGFLSHGLWAYCYSTAVVWSTFFSCFSLLS